MTAAVATTMSTNPADDRDFWPHRVWHYPAHPRSAGTVRRDVAAQLHVWDLDEMIDTAVLVVSEIAANAVLASAPTAHRQGSSRVAVRLSYSHRDVIVEVWDGAANHPIRQVADLAADNGRGLHIVAALARDWGYYRLTVKNTDGRPPIRGKVVWAALPHSSPPGTLITDTLPESRDLPRRSPVAPTDTAPDPEAVGRALLQRVIDARPGRLDPATTTRPDRHTIPTDLDQEAQPT